ncbi:Na+/H+ antiporter [Hoylesella nanceiensis]|uniref:Na+/H+ antiporter n=1 Tax=Hoylesella nanceiensis TaxID=425941 RepID=UPI001CABC173|nr:Na+/H+ antiporter [Hoylesella nanceiensis]MBF1439242.1 Na+/H+ antiporter [Hoylesella nanceiensis]
MVEHGIIITLFFTMSICLLTMLSSKLKVAYPILLVVAGLLFSLIPGIPKITINPDVIFLIFLPPILYEAAISNSWKELWRWRRVITSFAFIVVFITASVVAFIANHFIPGFSIPLGFLLGGIVSPPDAVSAAAIMKFVKVPRRISAILEGESLFNDASSLIIVKFALISVGIGQFIWYDAAGDFLWMVVGGVAVGIATSYIFNKLHNWLPMDENINIIFSLVSPYIMYLIAEEIEASGVLAVVSGGLFFSYRRILFLSSSSRLRAENVWSTFSFLLNGFAFLLIGLDLSEIMENMKIDGVDIWTATGYGVLITIVLIIIRMGCAFGALLVTFIMRNFIKVADPNNPGKAAPIVLGWTGMRGVVSLAAALSIPLTVGTTTTPFPMRSLILYITFIVILLTLVIQGLTLPVLLKYLRFPHFNDHLSEDKTKRLIRKGLAQVSLDYLNTHDLCSTIEQSRTLATLVDHWVEQVSEINETDSLYGNSRHLYIDILEQQRLWLYRLNNENPRIDQEIVNHFIHRIDLEEERMRKE